MSEWTEERHKAARGWVEHLRGETDHFDMDSLASFIDDALDEIERLNSLVPLAHMNYVTIAIEAYNDAMGKVIADAIRNASVARVDARLMGGLTTGMTYQERFAAETKRRDGGDDA